MLLIGSQALKYHYPDFRKPKDWDIIASTQEVNDFLSKFKHKDISNHAKKRKAIIYLNNKKYSFEFELIEHIPSAKLLYDTELGDPQINFDIFGKFTVASPQALLKLKQSHITFPIHWWKNIYDYHFILDKLNNLQGDYLTDFTYQSFYNLRYYEIKNRLNKKEIKFDMSNEDFFAKSETFVKRKIPHDKLHNLISFYGYPLFTLAKDDLSKAALSGEKVNKMTKDQKIKMIQEEAMVLALERDIIPNKLCDIKYSYNKMAGKMVYHYLPEFLRLFAANNFLDILEMDNLFIKRALNVIQNIT